MFIMKALYRTIDFIRSLFWPPDVSREVNDMLLFTMYLLILDHAQPHVQQGYYRDRGQPALRRAFETLQAAGYCDYDPDLHAWTMNHRAIAMELMPDDYWEED